MEIDGSLLTHLELLKKGSRCKLYSFVEMGSSVRYNSSAGLLSKHTEKLIRETKETNNLLNILENLGCVGEERLEEYYHGGLSLLEREQICKHLEKCTTCLYRLDILCLMDSEQDDVPPRLVKKLPFNNN